MLIEKIRLQNLNSLAGEWQIDLTDPAYVSDGIFAITGPTGSGKTTILDALCLALYGRTPRLDKVTQSGNETMSRRTGECLAEVTFQADGGRYVCRWSQHRARRKADGALQPPQRELTDAVTNKPISNKVTEVERRIEELTGLDFDRFTRSMLLAQGEFTKFLNAKADERAPILEQITGTGIYSDISIKVHELRSSQNRRLEELKATLEGLEPLSEEVERQLRDEQGGLLVRRKELKAEEKEVSRAKNWLEGLNRLDKDLTDINEQRTVLTARLEKFAPDRDRLKQALKALELDGDHTGLKSLRAEDQADRDSLETREKERPGFKQAAENSALEQSAAAEELKAAKEAQAQAGPEIIRARELDVKIQAREAPIQEARAALSKMKEAIKSDRGEQAANLISLRGNRKKSAALETLLDRTSADGYLVEDLSGLTTRIKALIDLIDMEKTKQTSARTTRAATKAAAFRWRAKAQHRIPCRLEAEQRRAALAAREHELQILLGEDDLPSWRAREKELSRDRDRLEKATSSQADLNQAIQAIENLNRGNRELENDRQTVFRLQEATIIRREALEKEVADKQTVHDLSLKVQSYEQDRLQLKDGRVCPLCGSIDHPYAQGNEPQPSESRQALDLVTAEFDSVKEELNELKVKLTGMDKDISQTETDLKTHQTKKTRANQELREACGLLYLDVENRGLSADLASLAEANQKALDRTGETLSRAEELETGITRLRQAEEQAREALEKAVDVERTAGEKKNATALESTRLTAEAAELAEQVHAARTDLSSDLDIYSLAPTALDDLEALKVDLTARRDRWNQHKNEQETLTRQIADLERETANRHKNLKELAERQTELKTKRAELERQRAGLEAERQEVLGGKDPDEEQKRLAAAVQTAEDKLEKARETKISAENDLTLLTKKIDELDEAVTRRATELQKAEADFTDRLAEQEMAGEAAYLAARLPQPERRELARRETELDKEKTGLETRQQDTETRLEAERVRKITDRPLADLQADLDRLGKEREDLQQGIGGIDQQLKANQELKTKQADRMAEIEDQTRECARWANLHKLIGHSEGKRYRNYAQGLTFALLIGKANLELSKMSDRYLLIPDRDEPLQLSVVDNYQAGEIRSTRNLSGGESFIVSLALALGLSHLAGQKVRVDSLFLDEGFGTLDDEALETALESLTGLKDQGKMIGLISHVPALKDRIPARIRVRPLKGGRSSISGPGCQRLSGEQAG